MARDTDQNDPPVHAQRHSRRIRLPGPPSAKISPASDLKRYVTLPHTQPSLATPAPNILNFTGERFAPEVSGAIWYEHWHRYCVAQPLTRGLRVLDAACGEGYGSFLLAQTAKKVVGIDIAPEAVAHARSRYVKSNLRYVEGSCTALPLANGSIDLIVSFETIEHLHEQSEMLAEFRRVLVPNGVLVISSPNPPVYSEKLQSR